MNLTLKDYLNSVEKGVEVTVTDTIYDMETYFYADEEQSPLAQWLIDRTQVVSIEDDLIKCDFSRVVEKNIEGFEKVYENVLDREINVKDVDEIIEDFVGELIHPILSGNISEKGEQKIVDTLKEYEKSERTISALVVNEEPIFDMVNNIFIGELTIVADATSDEIKKINQHYLDTYQSISFKREKEQEIGEKETETNDLER